MGTESQSMPVLGGEREVVRDSVLPGINYPSDLAPANICTPLRYALINKILFSCSVL